MLDRLKSKWKVGTKDLVLILLTFALGGSACGMLARQSLNMMTLQKGIVWWILYLVLVTIYWPICVYVLSFVFGQRLFFNNYLKRIFGKRNEKKINPHKHYSVICPISIFTEMSQKAAAHQAINLAQGFPDFAIDNQLQSALHEATREGANQYAPMLGLLSLRELLITQKNKTHHLNLQSDTNICISPGATYAIYIALQSILQKNDEVIVLEPAYDSYTPNILALGGRPIPISLHSDFSPNWDAIRSAISIHTKAIIINQPHNPSGKLWTREDFEQLIHLVEKHGIYIISDEVYENIVFDQLPFYSVLDFESLRQNSFVIYSLGKSYHITGWKIGYAIAPDYLMKEFVKFHQYMAFTTSHPSQKALELFITKKPDYTTTLSPFYQHKRDLFLKAIAPGRFVAEQASEGTYFQLLDYRHALGEISDRAAADLLCITHGVASIPLSPFYTNPQESYQLRFCIAKEDHTLLRAAEILNSI